MKLLQIIIALAALSLVSMQTFAAQVILDENGQNSIYLPSCQGTASIVRNYMGELVLTISDAKMCSILEVQGHSSQGQMVNSSVIQEIPGVSMVTAEFHSQSGAHEDTILINTGYHARPHADVYLDTHHSKYASLNSCGGTVELKDVMGQVNLIFRNVANCSNFDIAESNGVATQYPNKKLQGSNGDRGGSFTLPDYILNFGHNGVLVTLKSDSGRHQDVIYLQFYEY